MTRLSSTSRANFSQRTGLHVLEVAIGLVGILAAISITPSMTQAGSLTDQVNHDRLTVLRVDAESGAVKCVEDGRWRAVKKADLVGVGVGDIVRVERQRLILLRMAVDEIAGIER